MIPFATPMVTVTRNRISGANGRGSFIIALSIGPSSVVKGGLLSDLVGNKTAQQKDSFVAGHRFRTLKDLEIAEAIGNTSGDLQWGQRWGDYRGDWGQDRSKCRGSWKSAQ
jgi:hypothetical protein